MISAIGWGLPDQYRLDLLTSNSDITAEQLKLISNDRRQYYDRLNQIRDQQLKNLRSGKQINFFSKPIIGKKQQYISLEEKRTFFRDYVLGSSAVDEKKPYSALSRMKIKKFDFELKTFYGGAYVYPIGIMIYCLKSIGFIEITKDLTKYVKFPYNIARMYICGRILNVMAFLGTLILLSILGNHLYGFACGTTAMLIYGFSPHILNLSVVSKPHIYAAFWIMLGLFLLILYTHNNTKKALIMSAICCGLGSGSLYPTAICLIMYPVLLFEHNNKQKSIKLSIVAITISIGVIVLSNPYFIIKPLSNLLKFLYVGSGDGLGYFFSINKIFNYLFQSFCVAVCFPFGIMGIFFVFKGITDKDSIVKRLSILFLIWLLILSLIIPNVRVSLFIMPLLCIITASGLYQLFSKQKFLKNSLYILFIPGIIILTSFTYSTIFHNRHYEPMKEWIETLKPGETIGFFGSISPVNMPAFPFWNKTLIRMESFNKEQVIELPQYIVMGNYNENIPEQWYILDLEKHYELIKTCGMPQTNIFFEKLINMNQSRKAAFIYKYKLKI